MKNIYRINSDDLINRNRSKKKVKKLENPDNFHKLLINIQNDFGKELTFTFRELSSKKIKNEKKVFENDGKKKEGKKEDKAKEKKHEYILENLDKIEYLDDGYEKLKKEFEELKISLLKKEKECDEKNKENSLLNENLKIYKNKVNYSKNIISILEEKLKNKEDDLKELNSNIESQAQNYQNILEKKELEIKRLKKKCESLEYKYQIKINENYSIESENTKLRLDNNGMKFKNDELEKSIEMERSKNKLAFANIKKKEEENQILNNKLKMIGDIALDLNKQIKSDYISLKTPTKTEKEEEAEKMSHDKINNNFGKIGIKNELLNCYMSSVLQILKNIKNFSLKIIDIKTNDNIIESLQKIFLDLLYSNKQKVSIREFKRYFGNEYKRFEGRQNNDSTYFLLYLIQYIHKNLNKRDNQNKFSSIKEYLDLQLIDSDRNEFEKYLKKNDEKNNSFIYDMFYGYIMNKLFCTGCSYNQITFQSYNILDLPIMNENKKLVTLEQCLNCYLITKDQKDIKGFDCSECKKKLLSLVTCILKLPKVLIINLKRVGETHIYNHEVTIPFTLKTKDVEKLENFDYKYELIGFIKHFGSNISGHNIAYSKNILDNKWYMYNDEIVEALDEYPSTEKSFLLFYQLIEKVDN